MLMPQFFKEKHLKWLEKLISCPSVTPCDLGAQPLIGEFLTELSPLIEVKTAHGTITSNTSYTLKGNEKHFVFVGHTDVVPAPTTEWSSDPFSLILKDNQLIGRGVVDMKGAIICFLAAIEHILTSKKIHPTIHILLTSNEEGSGHEGLQCLLERVSIPTCSLVLIGEPSSTHEPGDCIKAGRRGSMHAEIHLKGHAYHVAYAGQLHPIYHLDRLVSQLKSTDWDLGSSVPFFAKSSFQITKIQTQDCVENVIPAQLMIRFNIRYSPATSLAECSYLLETILKQYPLEFTTVWRQGATPWRSSLTKKDIDHLLGNHPAYKGVLSTNGGVSDGYKVATQLSQRILELGLSHESAHQTHEWTTLEHLNTLTSLYIELLNKS
jgi:succinyl-diaminopimelate desuccinylase